MKDSSYGDKFYQEINEGSYKSAVYYADQLLGLINLASIVDIGCGRGAWLKAFKDKGVKSLKGIDGTWNKQELMIEPDISFTPADLNFIPAPEQKYDLAICLEVAEHLRPESADKFVQSLCKYSDTILFSGAYKDQGGTDHFNEQPHTYWAEKFEANGFVPFDLFRPLFWGNSEIEWWYRQNAFLYVKVNSESERRILSQGHKTIENRDFMNCIHPMLYDSVSYLPRPYSTGPKSSPKFIRIAKALTPPLVWSLARNSVSLFK